VTSAAMDEHARLPGFSAHQGEQEVRGHGVGISGGISGRRHASTPGSFAWLPSWQKKKKGPPPKCARTSWLKD